MVPRLSNNQLFEKLELFLTLSNITESHWSYLYRIIYKIKITLRFLFHHSAIQQFFSKRLSVSK